MEWLIGIATTTSTTSTTISTTSTTTSSTSECPSHLDMLVGSELVLPRLRCLAQWSDTDWRTSYNHHYLGHFEFGRAAIHYRHPHNCVSTDHNCRLNPDSDPYDELSTHADYGLDWTRYEAPSSISWLSAGISDVLCRASMSFSLSGDFHDSACHHVFCLPI